MIAYTSWHWIAATVGIIIVLQVVGVAFWVFIMRHRRRQGGN